MPFKFTECPNYIINNQISQHHTFPHTAFSSHPFKCTQVQCEILNDENHVIRLTLDAHINRMQFGIFNFKKNQIKFIPHFKDACRTRLLFVKNISIHLHTASMFDVKMTSLSHSEYYTQTHTVLDFNE